MAAMEKDFLALLDAVRDIAPKLRVNSPEAEKQRRVPDESIALLDEAGVFRMAVPERFGGSDLSAKQQAAVVAEVAKACGSSGWVSMVWVTTAWMASLYPDRTQEEVFAGGSVRVSGGFTASGTLVPTEGGYILNGSWRFNTGVQGAQWNVCAATVEREDGQVEELFPLVPTEELAIGEDWNVFGAAGTGSVTSTAKDVFVPAHRVVDASVYEAETGDRWNAHTTGRNYNLLGYILATTASVFVGLATAALDEFMARLPGKGITYTHWAEQSEHPHTQIQVAVAANRIASCEALHQALLRKVQHRADRGEKMTLQERATVRGQVAFVAQTTKDAVGMLYTLSPASAIMSSGAFQLIQRDIMALSLHGLLAPVGSLEAQGRVLLGMEPGTDYV
ncbi:acyl-CoA dehydrogenase family protein [Streptomyces sp. ISL-112]|uniref:acyl-CoA dehydrogenase family protein n=1 Tax=unclassified Streptomyces TaxID=2593676 RepID=UPI001BE8FCAD|nr:MULTISPECIES: acyl-CoA dehydrogenase family protein [unclassified Streptomyces]MBT2430537.1 acyl-CoA dehydrogenase family protein [Streptomyces sp. ISL-112]MBT2466185.1 acyl-CoA dehydrogenase family protein [Streptomyces sp. ISL-63]